MGQRRALVSKAEPGLCLEVLEMMELTVNKQRCFQGHCGVTRPGWGKGTRKLKEESWIGVKVYLTRGRGQVPQAVVQQRKLVWTGECPSVTDSGCGPPPGLGPSPQRELVQGRDLLGTHGLSERGRAGQGWPKTYLARSIRRNIFRAGTWGP